MVMLHAWLQEEFRFGTAERGERCSGCGRWLVPPEQCVVLRARHAERDLWGPPLETWCMTCADVMDIQLGPRGGRMLRGDGWRREMDQLTSKFWGGLVSERGRRIEYRKRVW